MISAPRSALVTGATGFVGAHLARRLLTEGWDVRLLVRNVKRLEDNLRSACEVIVGDLNNPDVLECAVASRQVVFHCAANVATWGPLEAYEMANVKGLRNLLEAVSRRNGAIGRFVHLSSMDVYGFPANPCDEESPLNGAGFPYGETKIKGEAVLRELSQAYGIPFTILRPGNIIGPGSQFIERVGKELRSGLMLNVDGGRANAGFTYIDTLMDYMLWGAQSEKAQGETYNVRDAYDVTWREFLGKLRSEIGGHGIVVNLPFALAEGAAKTFEIIHRALGCAREPLLHRLIVRIFGRTCGHSAEKIRAHSGIVGKIGFDEAVARSADKKVYLNK
ncbi:MAG: NAD-dependent epimerase/dehydratase family protein [Alphaproteobacteria bacterium]|nr:NAD-dependent epimerase/dehydratase family protein [Alphaproteobacteria bacterium]